VLVWHIYKYPPQGSQVLYALNVLKVWPDEFLSLDDAKLIFSMMLHDNVVSLDNIVLINAETRFTKAILKTTELLIDFSFYGFRR